ncbi:MAG: ATP-dependent zinc metalloprotease FtsH [Victivallaceae bacterium]|nr:ATP-dependent zinc metalloprotease FtsH [Victivallaceae bacterium]
MNQDNNNQEVQPPVPEPPRNEKPESRPPESTRKPAGPGGSNNSASRRPPSKAAFVWLLIFALIGLFFVLKSVQNPKQLECDQTTFEKMLAWGYIKTAQISSETDRLMAIDGTYSFTSPAGKKSAEAAEAHFREIKNKYAKIDRRGQYHTRVLFSERLDQLLNATAVDVKPKDNWWGLIVGILPVLIIVGVIYFLFSRQIKGAGRGALQFGKSRARIILPSDLNVTFDDIAGADEAKEETKEIIDFLADPLKFQMLGGRIPKGFLLTGPPGTGKTLLAKAVACEAKVPFFSISGSDFVEMFVGVGASRVRDMFDQARKNLPCLIFIDEIDAVGRSRFSGLGGGHDEREQTLNAMLVEMDGLESSTGVIVIAATNRPDVLDPALLRPGRFDRQIVLDLPDILGRRQILEVHCKNIRLGPDIDIDIIAKTTPGFSGADLANLCNEAALLAARTNSETISQKDMEEARDKVRWGRERRSRRITERERRLTAYHEAGHTLVAMYSEFATPVHKVTIIPRGQAYLGATLTLPEEDTYTQSRKELTDELAVLMGGRAAEDLIFQDVTSGASSDIEHASHLARLMVCRFGMNSVIGPVQYGETHLQVHVRADGIPPDSYGPDIANAIDVEVKKIIDEASAKAYEILTTHKAQLETLAKELLEKETLTIAEIRTLLNMPGKEPAATEAPAAAPVPEKTESTDADATG